MQSPVELVAEPTALPTALLIVPLALGHGQVLTLATQDASSSSGDTVVPSPTPKHNITVEEVSSLLEKINTDMAHDIARVTAAISEVDDSVKLLRFDRMKACIRSARAFDEDEERNDLQIC